MRVGIFSDVHGNAIALDAVLADIDAVVGVDAYWVVGDVTDMGSDPVRCVSRLRELPGLSIVRGNGDRAVVRSDADALATRLPDISPSGCPAGADVPRSGCGYPRVLRSGGRSSRSVSMIARVRVWRP